MTRSYILISMMLLLVAVVIGCNNGEQLQVDVQKALAKHTEMNTYQFSGSADLSLEHPDGNWSSNPLTAGILAMVTNGELTWEGVASVDPVRLELLLKLTPHNASQSIEIPLLIQNNKMYIHIPAINEPEQYYEIDLEQLSQMSDADASLSPQQLGSAGQLFSSMFHDVVSAVNPKRFDEESSKSAGERSIMITLKQKQVKELIDIWFDALPKIISQLDMAGYIKPEMIDSWNQKLSDDDHSDWIKKSDDITINKPLTLGITIDEQGFVRETHMDVDISIAGPDQTTKTWLLDVITRYDDINQNPPFTRPIPDNVLPFTHILELIQR